MAGPAATPGLPTLLGHFRILEKIGAGGMGEVYRAHDERLDRDVAIKVLPPGSLADDSARKRFRKEAVSLSKLNHPNIAIVHDFDTDQNRDFLVMEYIAGTTLSERTAAGPLPEDEVSQLGAQLAEGLAAAHEQGIIHRDLKPGNVRLTPDGRLKILDFGLAKLTRPMAWTESTQSVSEIKAAGTLPYMAPEQLRGGPCDERTDVYGAGAVLYEMATGRRLYPDVQSAQLIDAIFHRAATPARQLNPRLSQAMEAVIGRALEKNPAHRQQSAQELLGNLRALTVPGNAAATARTTQWLTALKWRVRRQQRRLVIVAASVIAALLIAFWFAGRSPAVAFTPRDFVLISDFDNQTAEPIFEKSLTTAFTTSLAQSSYLNIYSRRRINAALKRMRNPALERIDEAVAQEIAVREGLKLIVLPSISGVGGRYRVVATIRDVASGKDLRTESVKAGGKERVLDALDTLSAAVRKDMGESVGSVSQSKRLSAVTTQSLDALRQYTIAAEKSAALQWEEAKVYFENALRIDPKFTSARASLGMLHVEQAANGVPHFDGEEGNRLLSEAVKHVDDLTDREKYGILAFHARAVERNPEKAVGYLKTLMALYPDDSVTHVNLGRTYQQMGRLPEATAQYQEATRIDPKFVLAYGNMAAIYLYQMGDVASAIPVIQKMLELDPSNAWALDGLGFSYFAKDNLAQAQAAFEKAVAANPNAILSRFRLAHTQSLQGRHQQALETLRQTQKVDASDISSFYDMGVVYERMGEHDKARASYLRYKREVEGRWKKTLHGPGTQLSLAAVSARLGESDRARQMLRSAIARSPHLHAEAAFVLSLLGEKREAVHELELAIQNGYTNYVWLKMHPDLMPLHGYAAYDNLIRRMIRL